MSEVYSPVQVGSPPAQSSDAKSCVSRGRNAFIISILLCVKVGDELIGRRKILRLYWLAHCGFIEGEMMTCR